MAVNYKIGADASSFKKGVNEAQASLKTLDAALKVNEASFKAGGDAQVYMEQKTKLLSDKMTQQKQLVTQLQQGLKQMREQGVSPTSVAYQKLEAKMLNAQTAMLETQNAVDGLDESQQKAAGSAGDLATAVNGIGKKISLDQVIGGINSITNAMETAAGKAIQLGEKIWDNIMDSARLSDDYATMASRYGVDVETLQKQVKIFDTMADTSIEAFYKAKSRISKAISNPTDEQLNYFEALGLARKSTTVGKFGETEESIEWMVDNGEDALWEVGQRLRQYVQDGKISQDMADTISQAFFSRQYMELNPLFDMGKEAFEQAVNDQTAASEKAIENNAKFNDSIELLKKDWETFKIEIAGSITPALTDAATSLSSLVNSFTEYAKSDEGQEMLTALGEAAAALFEDLSEIDPDKAIEGLTGVFDKLTEGLKWLTEHRGDVVGALKGIVEGWAGLRLTGGALQVLKLVNGLTTLGGDGSSGGGFVSKAVSGISTWGGNALTWLTEHVGGALNGVAVGDWFVNNTRVGQETRNTGDFFGAVQTAWDEKKAEIKANVDSFAADWEGLIAEVVVNSWSEKNSASEQGGVFQKALDEFATFFGTDDNPKNPVEVPTEPEVPKDAAKDLAEQVGIVQIPAQLVFSGAGYGGRTGGGTMSLLSDFGNGLANIFGIHANGLWSVPFDNYPALLHRGERVVPAREVSSRSYNSNLYVEKMIMNNGADAQGLANAMAAANRRRMSGYGS